MTSEGGWRTIHCDPAILFTVRRVGRIPALSRGTTRDEARAYMSLDSLTFLLDTWAAFRL